MKLKKFVLASLAAGMLMVNSPSVTNAEYITALEDIHYEKWVVDTSSLYYPDPKHKFDQFNCVVWFYTSEKDKGKSYTFRYKFEKNKWLLAEKDGDKLVWEEFEDTSPAANVLRIVIPFIGHNGNEIDKSKER